MSVRTGPDVAIKAAGAIANTNVTAMTAFKALGNAVKLIVTTTTGGCVSLTFTAETSRDNGTTYADVIDRDSLWSMACTTPTTAGVYEIPMEGLHTTPGDMVRLSFEAGSATGGLAVRAICWENPRGGGVEVSVGDVVVDVDAIKVSLDTVDNAVIVDDAAFTPGTTSVMMSGFTFDDATPDSVDEGDAGAARMSANRNVYFTMRDAAGNERGVNVDASNRAAVQPPVGAAAMAASQPVTVATDDTHFGAVGAASDVDGVQHGQLRYIGEALDTVIAILPGASGTGYKSYIDAAFVTGDSPQTHDVNTDLTRNGDRGYITNDGPGNISVQMSESGAVSGEDAIILQTGETFSLDGQNVDQITVTWVTDSAYRIFVR